MKTKSMADLFSLKGQTALVTGAAGQLGRQMVSALLDAGANVALADVDPEAAEKAAINFKAPSSRSLPVYMDTTSEASIEDARDKILKRFGKVDILVNNAGIGVFTPFETRSESEFTRVLDINVKGVFNCIRLFSRVMKKARHGSIINIGSVYGVVSADPRIYGRSGRNSSEVYAASKAGVIHMSRYFAVHLAPSGIRVNTISPGGVYNRQDPSFVKNYGKKTPMGRMAFDHEVRGALLYLASDASSYVTGHNLVVDGGFSIW